MPRRKPQIKKIEDKVQRRTTFTTRSKGLFKKAQELGIMCEAQVGVVVISEKNIISDVAYPDGIDETIENWKALRQAERNPPPDLNPQEEDKSLFEEYLKVREGHGKFSVENLQLFKELLQKMDVLLKEKEREKELSEEKIVDLQNTLGVENVVHQEGSVKPNANRTLDLISRIG